MKRDSDFIRSLLFRFEEDEEWRQYMPSDLLSGSTPEEEKERYHIFLLMDAGLVAQSESGVVRLTNAGHDYIEAIRDEGIWAKTKAVVSETGGSATLEIFKSLATGFLKKKIEDHTGLSL